MSREEAFQRMADISNALRQMGIDLGVRQERERIIKLLEAELVKFLPEGQQPKNTFEGLCAAIEIIKGENK
jgi:hypothetical protein